MQNAYDSLPTLCLLLTFKDNTRCLLHVILSSMVLRNIMDVKMKYLICENIQLLGKQFGGGIWGVFKALWLLNMMFLSQTPGQEIVGGFASLHTLQGVSFIPLSQVISPFTVPLANAFAFQYTNHQPPQCKWYFINTDKLFLKHNIQLNNTIFFIIIKINVSLSQIPYSIYFYHFLFDLFKKTSQVYPSCDVCSLPEGVYVLRRKVLIRCFFTYLFRTTGDGCLMKIPSCEKQMIRVIRKSYASTHTQTHKHVCHQNRFCCFCVTLLCCEWSSTHSSSSDMLPNLSARSVYLTLLFRFSYQEHRAMHTYLPTNYVSLHQRSWKTVRCDKALRHFMMPGHA